MNAPSLSRWGAPGGNTRGDHSIAKKRLHGLFSLAGIKRKMRRKSVRCQG